MPILALKKPLKSDSPQLSVENELAEGLHRFRLQVLSADGRQSGFDEILVQISKGGRVTDPDFI